MENSNTQSAETMGPKKLELMQGFRFLFQYPNAGMNLLFASLLNLIPFVGPIVLMGWQMKIFQRLVQKNPLPIPRFDFSDFVFYLGKGVIPFVVVLIVLIPFTFVLTFLIGMMAIAFSLVAQQGMPGEFIAILAVLGSLVVFFLGFLPLSVFATAAMTRAYLSENFSQSFEIGKIFNYAKATWRTVLWAYVIYLPISFALMIAGMLALYVGLYPAMVIMNLAWLHIMWQIYENYLAQGGEPIPLPEKLEPIPSEVPKPPPPAVPQGA